MGKVSSKRVYKIDLFHFLIHHHPVTSKKLGILFANYQHASFFFFFRVQISPLYRNLYKILIGDDCYPFLVIFRDVSCFIHKNIVVEFHVHDHIYRVRWRCSKLYICSQSSIPFPFLRFPMTKSGRCVEFKNSITRFIVNSRNIQTIIYIYSPYCCKQASVPIYVLIISKIELEWWAELFPIQIDTHLRCIKMFEIEWVLCNTFGYLQWVL